MNTLRFSGDAIIAAIIIFLLVVAISFQVWILTKPPRGIDNGRIWTACAEYANLDLSGWASLCRDAGFQE